MLIFDNWHGGQRYQTSQSAHGVVMDLEHVVLTWCARFAGQINSRNVKGADGLGAFQRAFQRASHPQAMHRL